MQLINIFIGIAIDCNKLTVVAFDNERSFGLCIYFAAGIRLRTNNFKKINPNLASFSQTP